MTDPSVADDLPQAGHRRTRWPGLIWALPLVALIIVVYLVIQWFDERGEVVTVTFTRAGGARAGETKVTYQGIEAGSLIKIVANKDGRRLDFKLRMVPEAKVGLNTNARFYLIGASPTLDLSSLRAVVSGISIGFAPGDGGTPADRFEGLDHAPAVLPGDVGTAYMLTAHTLDSIREGTAVLFRGEPIGKVSGVKFAGEAEFRLDVFIFQPYDQLIRAGDRFWKTSAVRLKFAGGAIDATLAPISTIFSGGIELDTTAATPGSPQSRAESEFTLYASRDAARQGLSGPTVRYTLAFAGAAGDLEAGAPVTLLGFQIGEVAAARLAYDERTGKPLTAVSVLIYPQQLDPARLAAGTVTDWPAAADAKMRQLIGFGYRAKLDQTPPLVGGRSIALVPTTGAGPSNLAGPGPSNLAGSGPSNLSSSGSGGSGGHRTIPTVPDSADFADIASRAAQILAKVNGMPLEDIGQNLKVITRRVRALVSLPEVADSLAHLDGSLTQIDELLGQVKPQLGPLVAKLNDAAGEISGIAAAAHQLLGSGGGGQDANLPDAIRQLTEAARAVRTLADYLDRHPEALIHGKRPEK